MKNVSYMSVQEFDNLVSSTYGRIYCFQQQDDCKERQGVLLNVPVKSPYDYENDTLPEIINGSEMGVSFKAWLERDTSEWSGKKSDRDFLNMFWERNFYPCVDMIINDLHSKGLLPEGELLIDIDW